MKAVYKQPVYPNDKGSDVLAYHRALRKRGYKKVLFSRTAGPQFVEAVKQVQKNHGLHADGIIGVKTFNILRPSIDSYGALLIKTSTIRHRPVPNNTQALAQRLLTLHSEGKYRADNPGDYYDLVATAKGQAVRSQCGGYVHMDARPLALIVWLIDVKGYRIGTFAFCSDHHCDGYHGHSGGMAVDISSINGVSIASRSAESRRLTYDVANLIHNSADHKPRQLICGGYGYVYDSGITYLTIPNASFYGSVTMSEHRNHIHAGY